MEELCRLLIIDDELILRNGLRYLCNWEEHGMTIVGEAANGKEALDKIEELEPHIVLMDIVMPVMNGIDFAKIMQKQYPEIKMVVLSSFSEFDYVREAFKYGVSDYLLKPKLKAEELLSLLEKVKGELSLEGKTTPKKALPSPLLKELLNPFNQKPEAYSELHRMMPEESFVLMKCRIDEELEDNNDSFKERLSEWIGHALKRYTLLETFLNNEYIVLINIKSYDEQAVLQALMGAELNQIVEHLRFIVSKSFGDSALLTQKNNELSKGLGKIFYFKGKRFVLETQIKEELVKKEFNTALFTSELNGLDIEACKSLLFDYFKEVKVQQEYDEYSFKRFCQNIIYNLINTIGHLGFQVNTLNEEKIRFFRTIDRSIYFEEIVTLMEKVFEKVMMLMNSQIEQRNSIILNKIIQYVEKHYSEEITLSEIADNIHINYYYLSAYFKNQTSENLTAYINKVRVEKAKILLQDGDLSIAEVSSLVGFSEHNYFSKVFKKYALMTPTSYRRKHVGWGK